MNEDRRSATQSDESPPLPASNLRSCLECRRRKIRCNKQQPCAYCTKVRMQCIYPRTNQSSRSALADQDFDTLSRLRRLEVYVSRLDERIARQEAKEDASQRNADERRSGRELTGESQAAPSATVRHLAIRPQGSSLSAARGTVAFHDSSVDRELGSESTDRVQDNENPSSLSSKAGSRVHASGADHGNVVFQVSLQSESLQNLHPSPEKISVLWQIFLENVDSLLKVFHAPTVQAQILEATRDMNRIPPQLESLMFAVYYAAVISVECSDWCREVLQEERDVLLERFRFGCEKALAKARFMTNPDIISLQALVLHLSCGRRELDENYVWSVAGVTVRLAIKLGLHRDPEPHNFSSFQCEVRRRLWWMIVALETRSAEDNGQDSLVYEHQFDTRFPSNINDCDISPQNDAKPLSVTGRTDMLYTLVRFEVIQATRRFVFSDKFTTDNRCTTLSAAEQNGFLDSLSDRLEQLYFKYCDSNIPICFLTMASTKLVIAKLRLALYHPDRQDHLLPQGEGLCILVKTATEIMEHAQALRTDERYKRWVWLFQKYVEWDAATFVLLSLNMPQFAFIIDENVRARAWVAVQTFFRVWSGRLDPDREERLQRLGRLRDRAVSLQTSDPPRHPVLLHSPQQNGDDACVGGFINDMSMPQPGRPNRAPPVSTRIVSPTSQYSNGIMQQQPVIVGSSAAASQILPEFGHNSGDDCSIQNARDFWAVSQQVLGGDEFDWPTDASTHAFDTWL